MGVLHYLDEAQAELTALGEEFALIPNAPGIFPPHELVPLGTKFARLDGLPAAVFLDMDGTTAYTEPLFLHDVEEVVRRSTGWRSKEEWAGIEPERDYPNIVGYSTIRNLEYLYESVGHAIKPELFFAEVMESLIYLTENVVPEDVRGRVEALTKVYDMEAWCEHAKTPSRLPASGNALVRECVARFPVIGQEMFANFGLIIFYADYLNILQCVSRGAGAAISERIYGDPTVPAIRPLPGIALLCALIKGWLPEACAAELALILRRDYPEMPVAGDLGETLARLCRRFKDNPVPVALVTSSGFHEVNLVLQTVFRALREESAAWPLDERSWATVQSGFDSYANYFDAIVTCDDVIEGRTKPYRDPYTLALTRLGLDGDDAPRTLGFEDTEAGIIAQRGAGVGIPCAVPIEHTLGQDFRAAAHLLKGGVLEAIGKYGLFID
jgi:hypothetical protein